MTEDNTENQNTIYKQAKTIRERAGISRKALAANAGFSEVYIRHIEQGYYAKRRDPNTFPTNYLKQLADITEQPILLCFYPNEGLSLKTVASRTK